MSTKDYRGKEIIISITEPAPEKPNARKRRGFIPPAKLPEDPLSRRKLTTACNWVRRWNFTFQDYRVFTVAGPLIYNGTRFANRVVTGVTSSLEILSANQGVSSSVGTEIVEAFDANALPMSPGTLTVVFDKQAGTGTITTPFGSYPISPPLVTVSGFGPRWFRTYQFRNYYVSVMLRQQTGATSTLSYDVGPNWVNYSGFFRVTRSNEAVTIDGQSVIQDYSQAFDYVDGAYSVPIPSPCDDDTADDQAELARASFASEFDAYLHIQNVVFGPMIRG